MRSALSVAIAVLLVSSLLPLATVAAAPSGESQLERSIGVQESSPSATAAQVDPDETTTRLGLDGSEMSAYSELTPDLGTTLASTDDELRREWTFHELEYNWEDIPEDEREERIMAYNDQVLDRLDEIDEREKAVVRAMAEGDASASHVLRTFARSDHEADVLRANLDRVSAYATNVHDFTSITRPTKGAIGTNEGPVRDAAFRTMSASDPTDSPPVVLVEATEAGVVISSVSGDSYAREANRYDNRDLSLPSRLEGMSDGNERLRDLYPWAQSSEADASNSHDQFLSLHQFTFEVYHSQGLLRVHMDSGTTDVFRETQELGIDALPIEPAGTWTGESTTVELNVTSRGGPIQFNVTDTETGTPLDATILVDGHPVTETDANGAAWIVRPMNDAEIVVQADGDSVPVDPDR